MDTLSHSLRQTLAQNRREFELFAGIDGRSEQKARISEIDGSAEGNRHERRLAAKRDRQHARRERV